MKSLISLLFAITLSVSFVGCGGTATDNPQSEGEAQISNQEVQLKLSGFNVAELLALQICISKVTLYNSENVLITNEESTQIFPLSPPSTIVVYPGGSKIGTLSVPITGLTYQSVQLTLDNSCPGTPGSVRLVNSNGPFYSTDTIETSFDDVNFVSDGDQNSLELDFVAHAVALSAVSSNEDIDDALEDPDAGIEPEKP